MWLHCLKPKCGLNIDFFSGVPVQQNISIVIISLVQFQYTQVIFYKESMKYLKYIGKKRKNTYNKILY